MKNIEELLPEDFEKIDQEIRDHKAALFKLLVRQFIDMGWGTKRSAKALKITNEDFKKMSKGEIDQWNWEDGLKFLIMVPSQIHLMIRPFFLGARRTNAMLPIHLFPEKEKPGKEIAG
jgi:hypothetical protein